jgi:hypothetical protein
VRPMTFDETSIRTDDALFTKRCRGQLPHYTPVVRANKVSCDRIIDWDI